MHPRMFEGWSDYFLLIGSAAAALIGLLFIVATLSVGRELEWVERGQKLYLTPIVFHLGGILLLSGLGMAPIVTPLLFGAGSGIVALIGLVSCVRIGWGMYKLPVAPTKIYDLWWYGIIPAATYALLIAAAALLALRPGEPTLTAVAALLMAQLLVSIHSAWDLVTYLAPRAQDNAAPAAAKKKKP
jgi:hypothetical protein